MKSVIDFSLILPVYNEEECIESTVREAYAVMNRLPGDFEMLAVDDGSDDGSGAILKGLAAELDKLRVIRLAPNSGQSAALGAGIKNNRGKIIITMDADGQNDPADIPRLIEGLKDYDMCCGYRMARKDSFPKSIGSRLANWVRNRVLNEGIIDTGCTLKAFKAGVVPDVVTLRGMHRFLPALARMEGAKITQIPVRHRPRKAGRSKYTNIGRLRETVWDLWAVRWMQKRKRHFKVEVEDENHK